MRGALPFLPPALLGVALALGLLPPRARPGPTIASLGPAGAAAGVARPAAGDRAARPHPAASAGELAAARADGPTRARGPRDGAGRKPRAAEPDAPMGPYTVRYAVTFQHLHTRELLPVALRVPEERLATFLRCRATGHTHAMAREPFGVAVKMAARFGASRVEVVSGYRSTKLNERLRKKGHEVASDSQHTHGAALDFALPGVPAAELARAVGAVHVGGIGTYRQSGFVHVDTGRARRWNGR